MIVRQNYWCLFKILGGGKIKVPYTEIKKIIIDSEALRSKLYLKGEQAPILISSTPEEIEKMTNQIDNQ